MTKLLPRRQTALRLGIDANDLAQFETDNPDMVAAAGVRRHYNGQPTIWYRPGALDAWINGERGAA